MRSGGPIFILLLVASSTLAGVSIGSLIVLSDTREISEIQTSSVVDTSKQVNMACDYLASNFNAILGLIPETPSNHTYWIFSDNYLASLALKGPCNRPDLANEINASITRYTSNMTLQYQNRYQVLTMRLANFDWNGSEPVHISGQLWTTVDKGKGPLIADDYADIAFLQAYYIAKWTTDCCVRAVFGAGANMYNGTGFVDRAFTGQFQTYKLALYIYAASALNFTVPLSALVNLAKMQNSTTGGFYTGYLSNYSTDGTETNTETTSLCILALASLYTNSTRTHGTSIPAFAIYVGLGTAVASIVIAVAVPIRARKPENVLV